MAVGQFSLRWNNYVRHVTNAFNALRCQDDMVDVTLYCEGKRIRAHKMLLSACSTYFREVFKENPCQHPVIIFRNVQYADLNAIINFMYQGEVNVTQDQLTSFLSTAELLEVQGLTDGTEKDDETSKDLEIVKETVEDVIEVTDQSQPSKRRKLIAKPQEVFDLEATSEDNQELRIISCTESSVPGMCFKVENVDIVEELEEEAAGVPLAEEDQEGDEEVLQVGDVLNDLKATVQKSGNELKTISTTDSMADLTADGSSRENSQGGVVIKMDEAWIGIGVEGDKPHTCRTCNKSFRHPMSLRQHYKAHAGATRCPLCAKVLGRVHDLKVHQSLVHGINK